MKRTLLLLAALALPGMAAAASSHADAMTNATIAFYSGFPSTGGKLLVKVNAQSDVESSTSDVLAHADSVVITISGHAYTFALDQAAKTKGQLELDVKGALKAYGHGQAKIAAVITELSQAQNGQQALVVLSRPEGNGHVVIALYHPNGGNAGLRVRGASHATVWIHGQPHDYAVRATDNAGLLSSLTLAGSNGNRTLVSVVADLQTNASIGASSSDSSTSSSTDTSAGLKVTLGGNN